MAWPAPVSRSSGGRSAVHTISGTRAWWASSTAGWKSAAAVPDVHSTTAGRPDALAAPRAKNGGRPLVEEHVHPDPGVAGQGQGQRRGPGPGRDGGLVDAGPGPLVDQGAGEGRLRRRSPSCDRSPSGIVPVDARNGSRGHACSCSRSTAFTQGRAASCWTTVARARLGRPADSRSVRGRPARPRRRRRGGAWSFEETAAAIGEAGGPAQSTSATPWAPGCACAWPSTGPSWCGRWCWWAASPGLADPASERPRRAADEALAADIERMGTDRVPRPVAGPADVRHPDARAPTDLEARRANPPDGLATALRRLGAGAQEPLWDRLGELRDAGAGSWPASRTPSSSPSAERMAAAIGDNARPSPCPAPATPPTWSARRVRGDPGTLLEPGRLTAQPRLPPTAP